MSLWVIPPADTAEELARVLVVGHGNYANAILAQGVADRFGMPFDEAYGLIVAARAVDAVRVRLARIASAEQDVLRLEGELSRARNERDQARWDHIHATLSESIAARVSGE